ncbi:MAG: hypothetical protein EOO70_00140 [Myxococcaceae bacterium]|nr:MAG: hypothetical protein EOO70_00140 [Myxococcaceae bacterium]
MDNRRCIYCLEEKSISFFNREHVVPQAFGLFEANLVLDCVCKSCNDFFSKELDLKFARDSIEGLDRFKHGVKDPSSYKSLGRRSTSKVEVMQEGPMKGLICSFNPTKTGDLDIQPLPQVGLSNSSEGPFEYFLLSDLPSLDAIRDKGYAAEGGVYIQTWGTSREEATTALMAHGFPLPEYTSETMPEKQRLRVDLVGLISHPEFRVVSKISMNYLASVASPAIALMPQFNDIRRYIRDNIRPATLPVTIGSLIQITNNQDRGAAPPHFLSVEVHDGKIMGQVIFHNRIRYIVTLSDGPFAVNISLRKAHIFDVAQHRLVAWTPPPLYP